MDKLLKMLGFTEEDDIDYSTLTSDEQRTYNDMLRKLEQVEGQEIKGDHIKVYITNMKNTLALELVDVPEEEKEKNLFLKARLKNYILLESFLETPERAKKALEANIRASGFKNAKVDSIV